MSEEQQPGRPTRYRRKIANEILSRLAAGESLRSICRDESMPPASTVRGWVVDDRDGFAERYARAYELKVEHWADEIVEIADNGSGDTWTDEDGFVHVNHDHIKRSSLRVDTRKWLMAKLKPRRYGERQQLEHSGPEGGPLEVTVTRRIVRPDADR